jgi:glycopeptide antibiotics resistance protein
VFPRVADQRTDMLRELYYLFLPYRSLIDPFLVVTSVAVPCWLIVRLARRRNPANRLPVSRETFLLVVVVYLAGVAAATLAPNESPLAKREGVVLRPRLASLTCVSSRLRVGSTPRGFCQHNARGNVLLFVPLGILLALGWSNLWFWQGVLIASALSAGIELTQYLTSGWTHRTPDVNDVILNTIGAAGGLSVVVIPRFLRRRLHTGRSR